MPRPRGSKNKQSITDQIEKLEKEIEEIKETLDKKELLLKDLLNQKKIADSEVILKAITDSGLSIEDALEKLKN